MPKYTTEPIDFTGCDPVIAEHLKRGEKILCRVYDNIWYSKGREFVYSFRVGSNYPYITVNNSSYRIAEPINCTEKIKRIMSADKAFPVLFAAGCKFDDSGCLTPPDNKVSARLFPENFKFFGAPLEGAPGWFKCWPEILEDEDVEIE